MKKFNVEFVTFGTQRVIQGCIQVITLNIDDAGTLATMMIQAPVQILNVTEIGYL